jgi:hypothetical protein
MTQLYQELNYSPRAKEHLRALIGRSNLSIYLGRVYAPLTDTATGRPTIRGGDSLKLVVEERAAASGRIQGYEIFEFVFPTYLAWKRLPGQQLVEIRRERTSADQWSVMTRNSVIPLFTPQDKIRRIGIINMLTHTVEAWDADRLREIGLGGAVDGFAQADRIVEHQDIWKYLVLEFDNKHCVSIELTDQPKWFAIQVTSPERWKEIGQLIDEDTGRLQYRLEWIDADAEAHQQPA